MHMPRFLLEDFFATYKVGTTWNLASSDVEPLTLTQALSGADDEVAELWQSATMAYAPNRGLPLLRAEIATRYSTLDADDIHVTSGATEAIFIVINALIEPGDHVVVIGPTYQLLVDTPAAAGADVTRIDLRFADGWALDIERVREAMTARTKLIVMNFPNNPTGMSLTNGEMQEMVGLAAVTGAWLLSDELYRGLAHNRTEAIVPAGADLGSHVISIGGVSKIYGLAGARIGWVACSDKQLLDQVRTYRYWSSLGTSALGEIVALAVLRRHEDATARALQIVSRNHATLQQVIDLHPDDLEWHPHSGATTALIRLKRQNADHVATRMAVDHGVLVIPSSALPLPGEYLRVGLGREGGREALHRFSAAL
jgi:aspartate/methionine/tyrosine aminotransferase